MEQPNAPGILETQGLTASLVASDTMFKAADVELVGKEKIGAAYVTIMGSNKVVFDEGLISDDTC